MTRIGFQLPDSINLGTAAALVNFYRSFVKNKGTGKFLMPNAKCQKLASKLLSSLTSGL